MVSTVKHRKLDQKGIPCWLVSLVQLKGLWDPVMRKIMVSRDVTFDESLLISDFRDQDKHAAEQSRECLLDPHLLVTEVLQLAKCNNQSDIPTTSAVEEAHFQIPREEKMEIDFDQTDPADHDLSNNAEQPSSLQDSNTLKLLVDLEVYLTTT